MKRRPRDLRAECERLEHRYDLSPGSSERLGALLELLTGDDRAPISSTSAREAVDVHLADSLAGLTTESLRNAELTADLGSGAGLPGLALAIARPEARFELIEASGKKTAFIASAISQLEIENATAVHDRAESWAAAAAGRYGAVTVRAVASLATLLEYATPLLKEGGSLIAWKGARDPAEEQRADRAAAALAMQPVAVEQVRPYERSRNRHLHVYVKVAPTPTGFPRRPGMAEKRPLGG